MPEDHGLTLAIPVNRGVGAEEAQTPAVELLEPFLALMPDAAILVDERGVIISANEHAFSLFRFSEDELIGRPIEVLVPERFRHNHRADRALYAAAPRTRRMGAGLELSGRRRDGSEFPVDISLAPITHGARTLVVAAIRDATERQTATAAMAQLAAIVQSSLDAVLSVNLEGEVASWNPGAATLFGYANADAIGRHISFLVPDDGSADFERLLADALSGAVSAPCDTQWIRRDGSRVEVALTISPLHDLAGRTFGFSALLRDISERKRAEVELRRLLAEERRGSHLQSATSEIRLSMLSGTPSTGPLELICQTACELLDTQAATISIVSGSTLQITAAHGTASRLAGRSMATEGSLPGQTVATGQAQLIASLANDPSLAPAELLPAGPALGLPIAPNRGATGALVLFRDESKPEFSAEDVTVAGGLADQAALSLELLRAREDRERILLVDDRERIARDLHDLVIQRLFGVGMTLQNLLRLTEDRRLIDRIDQSVDDLDATIREIRSAIFALEPPAHAAAGLRSKLVEIAHRAADHLGFEPALRFDGPVDFAVPDDVVPHVIAVVQEGLSNAARHSHASNVTLDLTAGDDLLLIIVDNGVGVGDTGRESGLSNLRERADALGGTFRIAVPAAGGTRLEWRVPLTA